MLLALSVTGLLCVLAVWAVVRVLAWVLDRLGLEPMTVLLWLGLAEWPIEQRRSQRQRLSRLLPEPPSLESA